MKYRVVAMIILAAMALGACDANPPKNVGYEDYRMRVRQCIIREGPFKPSVKDYCEALEALRSTPEPEPDN